MTLGELKTLCRQEIRDEVGTDTDDTYIKDTQLTGYANDAENEACRRARLLVDSTTAAVCQIAVVAGTATYALDSRVILIRRAKLAGRSIPLTRTHFRDLDATRPGWEGHSGTVEALVAGMDTGKIRLYRKPTANDTLTLTVVRLPLTAMSADATHSPEINTRFHRSLVFWMKFRCYDNQDSELYNPTLAERSLKLFEQEFGPKSSALNEIFDEQMLPFDPYDGSY